MSYNEDMAMEDVLYPWLTSDCMSDTQEMDFDPEEDFEDEEEYEYEDEYDGQPDEMQEWHDFDPDC